MGEIIASFGALALVIGALSLALAAMAAVGDWIDRRNGGTW
jgi:hypothetical protein